MSHVVLWRNFHLLRDTKLDCFLAIQNRKKGKGTADCGRLRLRLLLQVERFQLEVIQIQLNSGRVDPCTYKRTVPPLELYHFLWQTNGFHAVRLNFSVLNFVHIFLNAYCKLKLLNVHTNDTLHGTSLLLPIRLPVALQTYTELYKYKQAICTYIYIYIHILQHTAVKLNF